MTILSDLDYGANGAVTDVPPGATLVSRWNSYASSDQDMDAKADTVELPRQMADITMPFRMFSMPNRTRADGRTEQRIYALRLSCLLLSTNVNHLNVYFEVVVCLATVLYAHQAQNIQTLCLNKAMQAVTRTPSSFVSYRKAAVVTWSCWKRISCYHPSFCLIGRLA